MMLEMLEMYASFWKLLAGIGNGHWALGTLAVGFFILFVNTLRALFRAEVRCDQLERDLCQEMYRRSEAEWKLMQVQEIEKLKQESAYVYRSDTQWTCSDAGSLDLGHVAEKRYSVRAGEQEIYLSPREVQKYERSVRELQENQARAYLKATGHIPGTGESK